MSGASRGLLGALATPVIERLRPYVRTLRYGYRTARGFFGRFPRECTVCGHRGRFFAYGNDLRLGVMIDALCPRCLSLGRHRLLVLCDREKQLFAKRSILHIAPEHGMRRYILSCGPSEYVTGDLKDSKADLKIDIEHIDLPDERFELVYCSHVLEHVNDALAIPELWRIVKPNGLLIAMMPVIEGWSSSFEDASKLGSVESRILYFGQHDHVRYFGSDVRERLAAPGFRVEEYTAVEPYVSLHGLARGEKVFLCRKA